MHYTIRHITRFRYSAAIAESVMELRMQPRSDLGQRCLSFAVSTTPRSRIAAYADYLGNTIHHFNVPRPHTQLEIITQSLVESITLPPDPAASLDQSAWAALDEHARQGLDWDFLQPSQFVQWTPLLLEFAHEIAANQQIPAGADPLSTLRAITSSIYERFEYVPQSTNVDSPIDEALATRRGVCQDYTHVMLSVVRRLGIPCRYVSGYLFHRTDAGDRSAVDATHAWVEAWLPELGWVGFDPTNDLLAGDRHLRVAVGRDYADVPPTRGVFKGDAVSELEVAVQVLPTGQPLAADEPSELAGWLPGDELIQQQQQQQQ
jgi:transglutaminase-like putative cysteine protease